MPDLPRPPRPTACLAIFWITVLAFPLWWLLPIGGFVERLVLIQPLGQGMAVVAEFGGWQSRLALSSWALEHGWWSALLTHLLVHGGYPEPLPGAILVGVLHLSANMLTFVSLGRRVEAALGSWTLVALYLLGGLLGGLLQVLGTAAGPGVPLVGASGAVFGVVMAYCLLFARQRLLLFFVVVVRAGVLGWVLLGLTIAFSLAALLVQFPDAATALRFGSWPGWFEILVTRVGHLAHLGGALVGLVWGLAARSPLPPPQREPPALPSGLLHARAEQLPGPAEELVEAVSRSRALSEAQREHLARLRAEAIEQLG